MTTKTQATTDTDDGGVQRLADTAGDLAQQATAVAEQRASSTMTQVGDSLGQVARAVRDAGESLRDEQPQVARLADTAAQQVERAGEFLRERDAREVIDAAQDFARRQPAIVIGGGLALGLLVGRALKSASASSNGREAYGYRSGNQWRSGRGYGATAATGAGAYGTSSSYEAAAGYGASDDYTGGAGPSSTSEMLHEGDSPTSGDATAEEER